MKVIMGVIYIMFSAVLFGETLEVWHYYLKNLEKQFSIAAKSYETKSGNKIILRRIPMDVMNTRFKVLAEKGGGPDIIVGPADWIGQLSGNKTNNLLFPIDEFLTEKKKRSFLGDAYELATYNGHTYGLPFGINNLALIYNKALVKEGPKTTSELIRIGRALMNEKEGIYGLVYNNRNYYYHWLWVTGFKGNPLKNKKTTFNSNEQINAVKFAKSLEMGDKNIMPSEINEEMAVSLFSNGKAGMIITGPWEINEFFRKGIDIGIVLLPVIDETAERARPIVGGDILMISANSKKVKTGYEFIDFLTSSEAQVTMYNSRQFIPAVEIVYEFRSIRESEIFHIIEGFMKQAKYSVVMPRDPELLIGVWAYGNSFLGEVFENKRDVNIIADEIQKKSIKALEDQKDK